MKNGRRDVDWDSLEGPYGSASEVPALLQMLRAHDRDVRLRAEHRLHDHLQDQGLLYAPSVAAVPVLIDILADETVPDRLPACRLLQMIVECAQLYELPAPVGGPTLADLAFARSDWWLSRSPEWQEAGGHQQVTTSAVDADAYEAVQAGVPTYLRLVRDDDRDLRIGMASLLGCLPLQWPTMSAVIAAQLMAEQVPEVAAAMCIAVGQAGQPSDGHISAAVSRWRGHTDPYVHRCALIGLARVLTTPDVTLLGELADCLVVRRTEDWQAPELTLANAAVGALDGRRPADVPQLANLLVARLRVQEDHEWDFLGLQLLLSLAFPVPLPDQGRFADVNRLQRDVAQAVFDTGQLHRGMEIRRAVGECNLPHTHEDLGAWLATR